VLAARLANADDDADCGALHRRSLVGAFRRHDFRLREDRLLACARGCCDAARYDSNERCGTVTERGRRRGYRLAQPLSVQQHTAAQTTSVRGVLIYLTRLTNDRHRLEVVRDDGTREARELETRSALLHDLVHYVVETEAGLGASFYGRLARGEAYDALTAMPPADAEAMQTEQVVVRIQGIAKNDAWAGVDPAGLAASIAAGSRSLGQEPPAWLTGELIVRVRERLRRVQGQWRATPFHRTLVLEFRAPARGDDATA
jgi:hypothetical protein